MKAPLVVLVLFLAVPLFAQDPSISFVDIQADLGTPDRIGVGLQMQYTIEWKGIDPAAFEKLAIELDLPFAPTRVLSFDPNVRCTNSDPVRCTFHNQPSETSGRWLVTFIAGAPGSHVSTARFLTDGTANNVATHAFEVVARPVLVLSGNDAPVGPVLEPGQHFSFRAHVSNRGATPATNVVWTTSLPAGGTIVSGTSNHAACNLAANTLTCTAASLPLDGSFAIEFEFAAPERESGGEVAVEMVVTSAEEDFDPADNHRTISAALRRLFAVTGTADEGSGSLRQTIHDVNALCPAPAPCGIVFRIAGPVPQAGWFTIRPRTPLPAIGGVTTIDGTSQTAFTGDTNAAGPEIELSGEQVVEDSGLRLLADCPMEVRGLAVNGFRGYGIEVRRIPGTAPGYDPNRTCFSLDGGVTIANNDVGTSPTGREAKPNHRGIGIFTPRATVTENLISGNRRAGIYAAGSYFADIFRNRIGVASDGSPLGNGAGIMFDLPVTNAFFAGGADVLENVIAYNDIAIGRTRVGEIFVSRNGIFDNRQQAIDVDLDAITSNRGDDRDVPNRPVLFSATYDPVRNTTIVRGHMESMAFASARFIEVFASLHNSVWSMPQAERSVALQEHGGAADFEITVPFDLRGLWITAAFHARRDFFITRPRPDGIQSESVFSPANTSELSDAVPVH